MANPFFSGRIPQELYDLVDQRIKESGEGKTQILINALSQYLGFEVPKSSNVNTDLFMSELEKIKERVSLLERSQQDSQHKQLSLLSDDNTDDNKVITKPKSDNKTDNIIDNNLDNKIDNIADNKIDNKTDNSIMILTSKEVTELTGIARQTFEDRHKAGKLPISKNGYAVIAYAGKQAGKPFANLWKVKTDNG